MGVKFGREYEDILVDIVEAVKDIPGCYEFFGMDAADWNMLPAEEQSACLKTLADDVFFALGADPVMELGESQVSYDKDNNIIKLVYPENVVRVVYLV